MARHRSEFQSRGKLGKLIDWGVVTLFCSQLALLLIQLAVHDRIPWALLFIPLYILFIPLLLIAFGVGMAGR